MKIFNYQVTKSYGNIIDDINSAEIVDNIIKLSFDIPAEYFGEKNLYCNINLAGCQRNLKLTKTEENGSFITTVEIPSDFMKEGKIDISLVIIKSNRKTKKQELIKSIPCEAIYLYKTKVQEKSFIESVPELVKMQSDIDTLRNALISIVELNKKDGIL